MTTSPDLDKKILVIPTRGSPSADLGVADTRGFDWIELISQVILAAIGVTIAAYARAIGPASCGRSCRGWTAPTAAQHGG